jgi:hypothetical protein
MSSYPLLTYFTPSFREGNREGISGAYKLLMCQKKKEKSMTTIEHTLLEIRTKEFLLLYRMLKQWKSATSSYPLPIYIAPSSRIQRGVTENEFMGQLEKPPKFQGSAPHNTLKENEEHIHKN